jgi:hypothetical protein
MVACLISLLNVKRRFRSMLAGTSEAKPALPMKRTSLAEDADRCEERESVRQAHIEQRAFPEEYVDGAKYHENTNSKGHTKERTCGHQAEGPARFLPGVPQKRTGLDQSL